MIVSINIKFNSDAITFIPLNDLHHPKAKKFLFKAAAE